MTNILNYLMGVHFEDHPDLDEIMRREVVEIASDMKDFAKIATKDMYQEQDDRNEQCIIEACAERHLAFHPYVDLYRGLMEHG